MKRSYLVAALLALICPAETARAAAVDGWVELMPVGLEFRSFGNAAYVNDLGQVTSAVLSGEHRVTQVSPNIVYETGVQETDGTYDYVFEGPADPGRCYDTSLHVIADPPGIFNTREQTWTGDRKCASVAHNDPPPEVINPGSPIVINFSGRYSLSGTNDPVLFDIDGDGVRNRIGWTARGSDDAFLALDRDRNGVIDDGPELFGNATRLRNGTRATHGFEALKDLDHNGDGVIDSQDGVWADLLLWRDADHDGVSTASELSAISNTSITAIGVESHWTGRHDKFGNEFRYKGWIDADPGTHVKRAVYDIFFVSVL